MKVLIITNLYLSKSATLPDRNLFLGLHSKGVDLTIITRGPTPESIELESAGIKLVYQYIEKKIDFPAIRKIRSLLKEEKYDILHFTFGKAITNGLIASFGLKTKIIAYFGSLRLHWHDPFSYLSFLNHRIDRLICVSDAVKEHVLKQAPLRMKKIAVRIYKGADPAWFKDVIPAKRKELSIPDDAFIVCCVANIRKIKGLDWLIKSADFLPANLPVWFLLVGDKTDSEAVREKIERTGHKDKFITTGYTEDPNCYTALCDLYIQPSVSEGLGRSVIEAMCLGKPVVVTNKGGAKELVKEGITGFVVPVKSAKAIADIIADCCINRSKLPMMGEKARESVINDFNHKITIESTFNLYMELLAGKQN
jgi:L-malate glycosyltransferase